jgi:hypothetical protein
VGKGIDRLAVEPRIEVDVGRAEGERHQRVEPAVAGEGDRLATRHDLSDLDQRPGQVRRGGHQSVAVIDEDLQPAAVELRDDPHDLAGRRGQHRRAHGDGEVGSVVAVVGQIAAAEILDLGLADRPAQLDGRLPMVEEGDEDGLAGNHEVAAPEPEGDAGPKLLQARQIEPARRHVLLAPESDQRLVVALPPRVEAQPFAEESDLWLLGCVTHTGSTFRNRELDRSAGS